VRCQCQRTNSIEPFDLDKEIADLKVQFKMALERWNKRLEDCMREGEIPFWQMETVRAIRREIEGLADSIHEKLREWLPQMGKTWRIRVGKQVIEYDWKLEVGSLKSEV